jgi:hypothetical protein
MNKTDEFRKNVVRFRATFDQGQFIIHWNQ